MSQYEFFLVSALEKVLPARRPAAMGTTLSTWPGEHAAVQLVYTGSDQVPFMPQQLYRIEIDGAPWTPERFHVELIPAGLPCYPKSDEDYLSKEPGLFPDLLTPADDPTVLPLPGQYRSLWIRWNIPADAPAGDYPITLRAVPVIPQTTPSGEVLDGSHAPTVTCGFTLRVGSTRLMSQRLLHTQWFHADCLAQYYGVEVFSREHWRILEHFIRDAGTRYGINMLLTPVFTPALDTPVGKERLTVQLVDIDQDGQDYHFGFEKLERWVGLCRTYGITHLEIPHLFTQWGACATPKIIATVDGSPRRIFGWDVPADSPEYRRFLQAFLPALRQKLSELGYDREHVYFHISDEPSPEHKQNYLTALEQVGTLLQGCPVLDALTNYDFYREGLVQIPVCAADYIQPFLDADVPHLWVYYCCVQGDRVPNRFFAMPSYRNRIMGVLMYLHRIRGFLQWGYNFYSAKYSLHPIDPYRCADGDLGFPAGDPFLVYPGADGTPLPSLRAEVQNDALLDLRALETLERLAGRERVEALIREKSCVWPITFTDYPRDPQFLLTLREEVAQRISTLSGKP